tara:strand:+ start:426 stop:572 length:147 start_codon:yes stop_codon:yes gene_type:complete
MEKKLVVLNIAIQKQSIKKASSKQDIFNAGRMHERKILIKILKEEKNK